MKFERKKKPKKTNIFFGDSVVQNESPWEKKLDLYIEQIHLFHLVDGNIKEGFFLFTIKVHMKFLNSNYRNPLRNASILITNNYPYF